MKIHAKNSNGESFEKELIKRLIKFDTLGIPDAPLKWYNFFNYTKGESLLVDLSDIAFIQYYHTQPTNKPIWKYEGCKNFSQLPPWLEMKIVNNHLIFTGTPTQADEGNFIISLFNRWGIIYRQIRIEVISKKQIDRSNYFMSFRTRPTSDVQSPNPESIQTTEMKPLTTNKSDIEKSPSNKPIAEATCVINTQTMNWQNINSHLIFSPDRNPRTFKKTECFRRDKKENAYVTQSNSIIGNDEETQKKEMEVQTNNELIQEILINREIKKETENVKEENEACNIFEKEQLFFQKKIPETFQKIEDNVKIDEKKSGNLTKPFNFAKRY